MNGILKQRLGLVCMASWVLAASLAWSTAQAQATTLEKDSSQNTQKKEKERITIIIQKEGRKRSAAKRREPQTNDRRANRRSIFNDYEKVYTDNAKTAHYGGFGIGLISMNALGGGEIDKEMGEAVKMSRSLKYDLGLDTWWYGLGRNNLSLVMGLGIEFNSIHFSNRKYLNYTDDVSQIAEAAPNTLSNARLHITYLTMPVLLEINSGRKTGRYPFFFNLGLLLKLKTASSSKVWWSGKTDSHPSGKQIIAKDLGLRPVSFDLIAQAGKGNWGLYATYSPLSPFHKDKGPAVSVFSCGLKLYFSQR